MKTLETLRFTRSGGFVPETANIQDRINGSYADLSEKLRVAAAYVVENPVDIATRSLRAVATTSGVSPATFSRLARVLGYSDYEQMREENRRAVEQKVTPFSERAHALREKAARDSARSMLQHQAAACVANIEALEETLNPERLEEAVDALQNAGTVLLLGSMGSTGLIDYFGYMGQWFNANWKIAGRGGTDLSVALSRLGPRDALLALSKSPYARRTVSALKECKKLGIQTVVITDRRTSPALQFADHAFIVPTESPQFFSSYASTLVLMETLVSMLLTRAGPEAEEMIRAAEIQKDRLGENWAT